jgi:hypothetical protein
MAGRFTDAFRRGMAWHTFLNVERDLIDITRCVALDRTNKGTWSEKIVDLLVLTGSKVDNVFREMRTSLILPQTSSIIALRRKPKANMEDYRKAYEPIYKFSTVAS